MRIEEAILTNLIHDENYLRKVLPFIRDEYFLEWVDKKIFQEIKEFVDQYNHTPTIQALEIRFSEKKNLREDEYNSIKELLSSLKQPDSDKKEWLVDETEKFCKDKAVYNAIVQSIQIIDGKDKVHSNDAIPSILQDALSVCFDNSVGHDYFEDFENRFNFYHREEERLPFDLEFFNKITKGGLTKKTLNVVLAGTGVGKSLFMCHVAASALSQGKNVLYITMEMAEERIAERIDANLMNISIEDLHDLPKQMFDDRIQKIVKKTEGKLIIKEYPTATAHAGHFRALLNELNLKKDFKPDLIVVDYLNICASSRYKLSGNVNSYIYIKSVAEELRGLAVEFDVPLLSATQTNREGFTNSDVDLTNTSESFGLPATADFMFALISTEELEKLNQIMVKQLKNRYEDLAKMKRFVIGVDKSKMKLYDVSASAQKNILQESGEPATVYNLKPRSSVTKEFGSIKI